MLSAVFLLTHGGSAVAGAWTKGKGDGVVIVTAGRQATPSTLLTLAPNSDDKATAQVYAEYGITDSVTVGASLFSDTRIGDQGMSASAQAAAFVRLRLHRDDQGNVAAVQFGGAVPLDGVLGSTFDGSKPDSTAELRAWGLAGTSWWGDWGSVFVSAGLGAAWRSEGAADELRGELTAGYKAGECCMVLLGNYATVPVIGRQGDDQISYKITPSLTYAVPPLWGESAPEEKRKTTLQLGVTFEPVGEADVVGITFSVWRSF